MNTKLLELPNQPIRFTFNVDMHADDAPKTVGDVVALVERGEIMDVRDARGRFASKALLLEHMRSRADEPLGSKKRAVA